MIESITTTESLGTLTVTVKLDYKTNLSLWDAIKLRIAGKQTLPEYEQIRKAVNQYFGEKQQ